MLPHITHRNIKLLIITRTCFVGTEFDGGVSSEAASLAGTLKLGKLIVLYDSNDITIEGSTDLAFTEDVSERFESYGWHVLHVADGNDRDAVGRAIEEARSRADRPSLITVKTKIGRLTARGIVILSWRTARGVECRLTKQAIGWPEDRSLRSA